MSGIKKQIVSAIKVLSIMAFVAALAVTAFPTRSYAASIGVAAPADTFSKITVKVTSTVTGKEINNADVVILDEKGNAVVKVNLGAIDTRTFELPAGQYTVIATAVGYNKATQNIALSVAENRGVSLALRPNITPNSGPLPSSGTGGK